MTTQPKAFAELLDEVRDGSQDAVWELIEQYGPHILRAVRRRMARELRSKFDSQDFVQAVWASFFTGREQLESIESPEQLMSLLAIMARNKIVDEVRRRMQTQKHDVKRERPIDEDGSNGIASHEPTPSAVAVARELWDHLVADQSPRDRRIVELRLAGETYEEIARSVDCNERTVRRVLERLAKELLT